MREIKRLKVREKEEMPCKYNREAQILCAPHRGRCTNVKLNSVQNVVQVRSAGSRGNGLFLTKPRYKGQLVLYFQVNEKNKSQWKYYIEGKHHSMCDITATINHSCDANLDDQIWKTEAGNDTYVLFFANRQLKPDTEVTFDYKTDSSTEFGINKCRCGSGKCRGRFGSKTVTTTVLQLLSKIDDIVTKTYFIGNREFQLTSNSHLYHVIDGPILYQIFNRYVTSDIRQQIVEKVKHLPICQRLENSPQKRTAQSEEKEDYDALSNAISPTTRTIISSLTDSPHFERLRKNLRDSTSSEHVVQNLKIAFDATLEIANSHMEHKQLGNNKRNADEM